MNAIQQSRTPQRPSSPRRRENSQQKRRSRQRPHLILTAETITKLAVNCALSGAAVSALINFLPDYLSIQTKLREIRAEVNVTQNRVNHLQADFNRTFDPQQGKTVMQEQSDRVDPSQRQVIWIEKNSTDSDEPG